MSFRNDLSILDTLNEWVEEDTEKLAVNIDRRLVLETPRDEGTAAASWIVSLNRPDHSVNTTTDPTAAIAAAQREIEGFSAGNTLYIQSNQPYIVRLNEGWSQQQANPGFIDDIVREELNRE